MVENRIFKEMDIECAVNANQGRVAAIDVLRGFDMFMLAGGMNLLLGFFKGIYGKTPQWLVTQSIHVEWNGFVAWDLVMPLFMFIVGAAMPFSLGKRVERGDSRLSIYGKVLRRVVILFLLGMIVGGNLLAFKLDRLVLFSNVLQSIAVGYAIAAICMLHIRSIRIQVLVVIALLVSYWALLSFAPFPGHVTGTIKPYANFAQHIDNLVLRDFQFGHGYTWILSSLNFGSIIMLGVFAGYILRMKSRSNFHKLIYLLSAGMLCLALGGIWDIWHPFNKKIFSSPFVLWTGGWSFLLLAVTFLLVDMIGFRKGVFVFQVIGANSIFIYTWRVFLKPWPITDQYFMGLARHCGQWGDFVRWGGCTLVVFLVAYYLYRKKTFIKV